MYVQCGGAHVSNGALGVWKGVSDSHMGRCVGVIAAFKCFVEL